MVMFNPLTKVTWTSHTGPGGKH